MTVGAKILLSANELTFIEGIEVVEEGDKTAGWVDDFRLLPNGALPEN